jgi:predicted O-linked N-acetylglucosamine transferase (SPINDLY family)
VELDPEYSYLQYEILHLQMLICDWMNWESHIRDLRKKIQLGLETSSPFAILSKLESISLQLRAAQTYAQINHPSNPVLGAISPHPASAKIRLGYFSANFHNHPVAFLMAGLFESHDRNKFETIAFSFGPDANSAADTMRPRLKAAFDQFIDVRGMGDLDVAQLARKMGIDIAVDLMGFTEDGRHGIFAARAAPVQVNYLGYPGTMGSEYMDYLIADKQLIPESARHGYTEKIAYLPCFQANDRKRKISDRLFTREELGLPQSGFVFCCFNNNYKITPNTFDGWMRILERVDGSVLWLNADSGAADDNLRREAAARGVDAARLIFAKRLSVPDYLARYRIADLFLDTLPYNAGTTASDALWAGLPVLTCTGEAFASRMAASLLSAVDLPELITSTQAVFEAVAVELASHPARLDDIKRKLQHNRLITPLFDTQLFTKHIEATFFKMHQLSQDGILPQHLEIASAK